MVVEVEEEGIWREWRWWWRLRLREMAHGRKRKKKKLTGRRWSVLGGAVGYLEKQSGGNGDFPKRHLEEVDDCQRCRGCIEDTLHVVRDCQVVREVWSIFIPPKLASHFFSDSLQDWLQTGLRHKDFGLTFAEIGLMIAWDMGYKKVLLQLDFLEAVTAILGNLEEDSKHGRTHEAISELHSRN
ncbi:hypothetical protein LINPERHAP2_LOCUS29955 [Linum perenne]